MQPSIATALALQFAVLGAVGVGTAQAAPPRSAVSLVFAQPTGTVSPTDSIPIVIQLHNASTSSLVVNNSLPNFGLDASFLPSQGYYFDSTTQTNVFAPFVSFTSVSLGFSYGCNNTFASACTSGTPYTFSFASSGQYATPFVLAAGATLQTTFGTYTPSAGPVAAGSYILYDVGITLNITGKDAANHVITNFGRLAGTCDSQNPASCPGVAFFSRTVSAVPEPSAWALMGLGLVAMSLRRRGRVA